MPGLGELLEVARRALTSQRIGMDTTSHNISNANTLGYSRQRASLVASDPLKYSFGLLGTGVMVDHIGRLRDVFTDRQIRSTQHGIGDATVRQNILSQIESMLNEPAGSGLGTAMTKLFTAFQDLSVHPEEAGIREVLLQRVQDLSDAFHGLNSSMTTLRSNLVEEVTARVNAINTLAQEISDLDLQITTAVASGVEPNDARDQRDQKIEELSRLVDITVTEDSRGSVMVSVGGTAIASRGGAVALRANVTAAGITIESTASGRRIDVHSGELSGVLTSYNTTIPNYLSDLDALASALMTRCNTLHSAGFGLGNPPSTGTALFVGTDASTIAINPAIAADLNLFAASGDGSVGNNDTALALAGVGDELLMNGNAVSLNQFYSGLASGIGSAVGSARQSSESMSALLTTLEQQRSSVSGVSLDEEMVNMIKFQHAYDAAAKVVTTTDELFQTILNMV